MSSSLASGEPVTLPTDDLAVTFRSDGKKSPKKAVPDSSTRIDVYDDEVLKSYLTVTGMTCSSCVANVERSVMKMRG